MKKLLFILLVIVALVIVLPLSFNNAQLVNFDYVLGSYELPLSWLIFGAFIFGTFIALLFFAISGWGWKLRAKSLKKQVNELLKQRERDEIAKQFQAEKSADA